MSSNTSALPSARDLLVLVRAPLAVTAIADGATGYLLGTLRDAGQGTAFHDPVAPRALALLAVASTALYWGGMALNDFFDRDRDAKLYPFRPIPSGRVKARAAFAIGTGLLALGVAAAFSSGGASAASCAIATAVCVLAYDSFLKRFRLPGCAAMASCRVANVLLGGAVALAQRSEPMASPLLYAKHALAIGIYVFFVTLLSTFEDEDAPAAGLFVAGAGLFAVPVALAFVFLEANPTPWGLPFFVGSLLLVTAIVMNAGLKGTKATGHVTVRWLLRGLLLLDAGALAGAGRVEWAVGCVLLIVPILLGAALLFRKPGGSGATRAPAGGNPSASTSASARTNP